MAGLTPRQAVGYRDIQRAVTNLFRTGQYDDVVVEQTSAGERLVLVLRVVVYVAVRNINRSDDGKRKYADEIRDDFALFRKLGIGVAAMDQMEKEIGI